MSTIATASKLKRKRSSSSSSSNSSKMLSVVASDGLAHLASLDLPALAASLRAYPVSTLCSTSQAIRRLLLRRYIPDRISKDLAGSSAAGFSHSSSLIQQQPALPIERLCIEGVRASRAAQRLAALPTSSKSIVAIHSSSHRKQLYIDTEIQRTLETVVQIIYHQAVHHSPSFSSSAASYEDLSPDLLELFVSVVQDDYGLLLSSMARKMLITPPSSQEPIVSTKSRILKSIHAPIRNPTSKGASIGMWCHEMLRRESTKDTSIAKRNVIQLLRILTMWVQAKLIDEKTCKGIVSWSMDRFVKYRPPLTDDSLLLTDSILSVVFQIARLDIGCDLAKLAQTCLDLVVLCSVEISSLSSLAAAVFEKALDIYSILAERNRQLRPLVLHQNTVDMVAHLLKLVQLQIEMVSSEQDQVCHATAKGLFDLARVLCQLLILGGSHSKWNSNASFLAVYDEEEEPVHVTDPTNISSFKSILRILTLAGGSPPEVDITSIPKNQLLLCRPSTIQCLTDASQLISSSAIFYLDACKERGIELQLLPKEFSQALVRLILVISQDAYVLQYKHARQQVLCQKLFRLGAHLATCEAFADGFRLIDSVVIRQFICLMGKILEDAIMNSQGQAEVGAVLHMDQQLASAVMKLVARLLERNPSRTILVDAGLLERLICMPYVKIVLSSPTDWQMQIFMGVMSLISRTAHDSNFRFRMKAGVVGIDSRDGSFGTSLATSLSVLAPPSPNGVVSFMVSLVIGSIYLLCTHRPSLLGHTYRVNLEHAATHAIDFLNENFGRDKSVVTVLCRPNLSEWMSEDILFVNGLSELCTGVDISMINSLLDLLGYIPENSTFDLLNLDIGETVPLKDKEDSKPIEAKTLHSAAYFLDAMLRFSATLGEMLKQKQTVRRLVQTALDAQDLKVQNVVQRITRRLFLGPILVQDMVLSSGYSTIMETLMDGLNDAHRTIHAERLLDGMLGSFSSDIILMDGSPSDQIKHPIQKQHHTCLVQTQTQTALDEALGLAMRIWRYGEQASTTNSSSKLFRDRARTAVCYLGADRLLRLHRSPLLSSEDDYFSENEATTFLWDVFSTVFSDPLSEETGTNIAIDLSKSYRGREASCEIEPENVAVDTSDDEVLLSWVHQRLRKALDFLGWRHLRHAERISDSKMGLPRPHLLIEVLSDEHIWTYKGTADTERPVTIVFADERDSLIRFDGDILENVSPAFSVMMNGPFSEHVSRCVKIQDASREVWVHILEFLLLDVTTSSDVDTVKTENILVKEETRPNPSCMWVSGAATGDMLRKFILVSKMYECASRYMMTRLQHECTAWMSVACLYAARSHNWELAIQLHWWIARHPDMHLYEGSAANTAVILRACNVRALLWSIKNAPQEKPITSI
ncbi:hypothetical protein BASA50_001899 [Batrachochytrium salamandrivorans]|uniref:BTB domain-containing protein n=1 Tax=Batrachochytrium salamandrivorans TaxID=1357716 RepID=A0ABQ8FMV5_9FUNG|nr:hypothetical protein BASA50_001899 [Batrachochytrium salamandrivorans]